MVDQPGGEPSPSAKAPYDALGEAKRLLRTVRAGMLATVGPDAAPFASLVSVATLPDGRPILLLSWLATHTRQLDADRRGSLLLAQTGKGDPLAHPRLTLTGTAERVTEEAPRAAMRRRFLARNPKAALYADFPDFGFWRFDIDAAHLNGGFARAARFVGDEVLTPIAGSAPLLEAESAAIEHMNADHRDALALYATVLAGAAPGEWRTSGLDPDGIDLVCGDRVARVPFGRTLTGPGDLRAALKALADRARTADGG